MTIIQLNRIGLLYFVGGSKRARRAKENGRKPGMPNAVNLSDHLLRDIGLLDGHDGIHGPGEPAGSARDMIDRYR